MWVKKVCVIIFQYTTLLSIAFFLILYNYCPRINKHSWENGIIIDRKNSHMQQRSFFHRRTILIAFIFACCLTTTRGSLIFLSFLLLKFSHFNIFSRLFSARQHFLGYRISPFTIVHKPPMHKTESARQAMHTQNYSHVLNSW